MSRVADIRLSACAALWVALLLPPLRSGLESTMSAHMLLHIPALVWVGWQVGVHLETHCLRGVSALKPFRGALLLCAMFTLGIWMIPRLLDLAAENIVIDLTKAVTLTLAGGLCLKLGWRTTGPVVRGLIHVEAIASLLRLGWVYAESPARLCTSYGLADQSWLGKALLMAGGLYATSMAWRALSGSPSTWSLTSR